MSDSLTSKLLREQVVFKLLECERLTHEPMHLITCASMICSFIENNRFPIIGDDGKTLPVDEVIFNISKNLYEERSSSVTSNKTINKKSFGLLRFLFWNH
ncbi:hypothetical protein KRE49_11855 [Elizabethkingia meningoseptica]|uniref:hypothetical protein n=1 Tax=Elizabethkingia meningoseptica TaxID=238 RepID=UPI0023B1B95B|nr:hypothetical protein [Elizabethkingia meningoseptica]MCT4237310.1 hypothetical protein [Elizabethkingia anophelis]MDE5516433.1 hypothetical protein [Elizabethkingia meningoseptica]MDN4033709.1 hypothetical protein [Elizabethkingia meningoseptica]